MLQLGLRTSLKILINKLQIVPQHFKRWSTLTRLIQHRMSDLLTVNVAKDESSVQNMSVRLEIYFQGALAFRRPISQFWGKLSGYQPCHKQNKLQLTVVRNLDLAFSNAST